MNRDNFNRLKIGDKIKINPNLIDGRPYGGFYYWDYMYSNEYMTIKEKVFGKQQYVILIEKPEYHYTNEMILNKLFIFGR